MSHGMARCAASSKTSLSLLVLGKSRMRQPARTDLCGGRPAMVVRTATLKKERAAHLDRDVIGPTRIGMISILRAEGGKSDQNRPRWSAWDAKIDSTTL